MTTDRAPQTSAAPPPAVPVQYPALPFPAPVRRNGARVRRALLIAGVLVMLLLLLVVLAITGLEVGAVNLGIALVLAVLPVPVYLGLALWIDRFEPEPRWMIASTFLWGAAVATFVALVVNSIGQLVVSEALGPQEGVIFGGSISAPIVEESSKAAVLFLIFWLSRDEFNGVVDGIVYAIVVGLGFATTENVIYYGRGVLEEGLEGGLAVFVVRGILTPFLHPLFTSLTGLGLGIASQSRRTWVRIVAPAAGLIGAVLLHSAWNTSALGGALVVGVYVLVIVPILLAMLTVVVLGLRREGRLVRTYLAPDVQRGALGAWEVEQLSSVRARIGASWRSLQAGGYREWRNCRAYHATASELAFLRFRVDQGLQRGEPHAEEQEYVRRLAQLRAPV